MLGIKKVATKVNTIGLKNKDIAKKVQNNKGD
jgi:hypothetical protein